MTDNTKAAELALKMEALKVASQFAKDIQKVIENYNSLIAALGVFT